MKVQQMKVEDLQPYDKNPRIITEEAVTAVARSIERYGFRQPLVVDENKIVIVGHTRLEAAKVLGLEKVPVHIALDMTEDEIRAYRVADNKTGEVAGWETELLSLEIEALMEQDFELHDLGMTDDDLSVLVAGTFSPELNPDSPEGGTTISFGVTGGDMVTAQGNLDAGIANGGKENLVDAICPECGAEFHLDPKNFEI